MITTIVVSALVAVAVCVWWTWGRRSAQREADLRGLPDEDLEKLLEDAFRIVDPAKREAFRSAVFRECARRRMPRRESRELVPADANFTNSRNSRLRRQRSEAQW